MFGEDTQFPTECVGKKFIRRRDLTPEKRLHMAFMALQGAWGAVTDLACEFMVSRTFIYMLRDDLQAITEKIFGECRTFLEQKEQWIRKQAIAAALCLRLEVSTGAVRTEARIAIQAAAVGVGLVLTTGNVLQPGTKLRNYLTMQQAVRESSAYSASG